MIAAILLCAMSVFAMAVFGCGLFAAVYGGDGPGALICAVMILAYRWIFRSEWRKVRAWLDSGHP